MSSSLRSSLLIRINSFKAVRDGIHSSYAVRSHSQQAVTLTHRAYRPDRLLCFLPLRKFFFFFPLRTPLTPCLCSFQRSYALSIYVDSRIKLSRVDHSSAGIIPLCWADSQQTMAQQALFALSGWLGLSNSVQPEQSWTMACQSIVNCTHLAIVRTTAAVTNWQLLAFCRYANIDPATDTFATDSNSSTATASKGLSG